MLIWVLSFSGLMSWVELDGSESHDPNEDRSDHLIYEWHCSEGGSSQMPQIGETKDYIMVHFSLSYMATATF